VKVETMTQDWSSRDLPGVVVQATAIDLDVMRMLRATRSSTVTLLDLRARLPNREPGLRDSLWALEAGGLVEVLDSSTAGLICVLTGRGRDHLDRLDARPRSRG
jgi:hypothetical protein